MNLPPHKAAQLENLTTKFDDMRQVAKALGLERSFLTMVYRDITGFGSVKDTFTDFNEKASADPTAGLLAR